jgi:hypothetical protein
MGQDRVDRLIPIQTCASLLLGVVVFCFPARVVASCGDYVTIVGVSPTGHDPMPVDQGRAPCNGPSCSSDSHPGGLPVASQFKASAGPKELAVRQSAGDGGIDQFDLSHCFDPERVTVGYRDPIYHPPRTV